MFSNTTTYEMLMSEVVYSNCTCMFLCVCQRLTNTCFIYAPVCQLLQQKCSGCKARSTWLYRYACSYTCLVNSSTLKSPSFSSNFNQISSSFHLNRMHHSINKHTIHSMFRTVMWFLSTGNLSCMHFIGY